MGYEGSRFYSKVEDEFYCQICTMVLENAVQSPCEHIFCNSCIKQWLVSDCSCPADRKPLTLENLKPAPRYFRNMLDRLEIKCDFQPNGCVKVVKLEYLKEHIKDCEYNPNAAIICDKGCNMKITRREYQVNSCFSHLGSQLACKQDKISELEQELSKLKLIFERQVEETTRLNDEMRRQEFEFKDILNEQRKVAVKLYYKCNIFDVPQKWRWNNNMKIQENILETERNYAMVKSFYSLEPENNSFKIKILEITDASGVIGIGLIKGRLIKASRGTDKFISYNNVFELDDHINVRPKWKVGDIIECGIKFPENFVNDGTHNADIYFSVNDQLIIERLDVNVPSDGYFPVVELKGPGNRVKYLQLNWNMFEKINES